MQYLDTLSWCANCEQYILPEKITVVLDNDASTPDQPTDDLPPPPPPSPVQTKAQLKKTAVGKAGAKLRMGGGLVQGTGGLAPAKTARPAAKRANSNGPKVPTAPIVAPANQRKPKTRTIISQEETKLYCSEQCRLMDSRNWEPTTAEPFPTLDLELDPSATDLPPSPLFLSFSQRTSSTVSTASSGVDFTCRRRMSSTSTTDSLIPPPLVRSSHSIIHTPSPPADVLAARTLRAKPGSGRRPEYNAPIVGSAPVTRCEPPRVSPESIYASSGFGFARTTSQPVISHAPATQPLVRSNTDGEESPVGSFVLSWETRKARREREEQERREQEEREAKAMWASGGPSPIVVPTSSRRRDSSVSRESTSTTSTKRERVPKIGRPIGEGPSTPLFTSASRGYSRPAMLTYSTAGLPRVDPSTYVPGSQSPDKKWYP